MFIYIFSHFITRYYPLISVLCVRKTLTLDEIETYHVTASASCTAEPAQQTTSNPSPSIMSPLYHFYPRRVFLDAVVFRAICPRTIRPVFSCRIHGEYRDYKNFVAGRTTWIEFWICFAAVPISLLTKSLKVN